MLRLPEHLMNVGVQKGGQKVTIYYYEHPRIWKAIHIADVRKQSSMTSFDSNGSKIFFPWVKWMRNYITLLRGYSKVPSNSAARLLIFKLFSYQHGLIWTYTLIKIQIIFLPTRLLSTIFYSFFIYFQCFLQPFFCYNCFNNAFFSCIFILFLVSRL